MKKLFAFVSLTLIGVTSLSAFEHISDLKQFEQKIAKGNVMIEFYATWCGPCKEMKKNLQKIDTKKEQITIYQVNIDDSQEIVDIYGTPQVPAILYIKNGKILQGYVGLKQMPELKSDIKKYFQSELIEVAHKGK